MFKKKYKNYKTKTTVSILEKLNYNYDFYNLKNELKDRTYQTVNNLNWFFPITSKEYINSPWSKSSFAVFNFDNQMSGSTWNLKVKNIDREILSHKQIKESKFNYGFINLVFDKKISDEVKNILMNNPKTKRKIINLVERKSLETSQAIGRIGFGHDAFYGNVVINKNLDIDKGIISFDFKFKNFKNAKLVTVYESNIFQYIQEDNAKTEARIRKYFGIHSTSIKEYFENKNVQLK